MFSHLNALTDKTLLRLRSSTRKLCLRYAKADKTHAGVLFGIPDFVYVPLKDHTTLHLCPYVFYSYAPFLSCQSRKC